MAKYGPPSPNKMTGIAGMVTSTTTAAAATATTATAAATRYLTTPRSAKDAAAAMVLTKKENRAKLSDNDRIKLQTAIITPLSPKFQLTSLSDSDNQLSIVYNLGMRVNDLRKRLLSADMIDAFKIITPNPADPNQPLSVDDLLQSYGNMTLESVRAHVKFLNYYGQVYDQENLTWSQTLLENLTKFNTDTVLSRRESLMALGSGWLLAVGLPRSQIVRIGFSLLKHL
jgi:hypothetical protein